MAFLFEHSFLGKSELFTSPAPTHFRYNLHVPGYNLHCYVGVSGPLQSLCRPRDVKYFLKAMTNSFQILLLRFASLFSKCRFSNMELFWSDTSLGSLSRVVQCVLILGIKILVILLFDEAFLPTYIAHC